MKVLIGVDDSAHSRAAVELVRSMTWPAGTQFVVLSAAKPEPMTYTLVDAGGISWIKAAEQEIAERTKDLTVRVGRELQEAGLVIEARVAAGDPREALVDAARSMGADLLVVGSHGRTGLSKLVMGSVASHVVAHAPCSVLVVRPKQP